MALTTLTAEAIFDGSQWVRQVGVDNGIICPLHDVSPWKSQHSRHIKGVLFPGFVNAHTHLDLYFELSSKPFHEWIHDLILQLTSNYNAQASVARSLHDHWMSGVRYIGDITRAPDGDYKSTGIQVRGFEEFIIGYPEIHPQRHYSPHSLYTVNSDFLRRFSRENRSRYQIHISESQAEFDYFCGNNNDFYRNYLCRYFRHSYKGRPQTPVSFLHELGLLDKRAVLVHMGTATEGDLQLVSSAGASIVTCPLSNQYLHNPPVDVSQLEALKIPWAIGTDGKCSRHKLDFLEDYHFLGQKIGYETAFAAATAGGAAVLGLADEYTLYGKTLEDVVVGFGSALNWQRVASAAEVW
ncbi:amidohydrolase family protein [Desulfurispira natronophila]|uniref:Cytosine/adenosine deaminase-related metal-dependent hydrolase n=1 Tax=Desulfurispira natronophila TaxID=682562 RepID=A0A7W7Y2F1_9BACT|nr:amidohydrolase family protein [Desulfurispira natronophila]MBB5020841.1 cytosine/adenosine deaminase-related metal-dependent hydrolase [Desulfurispira natronophila]